MWCILYWLSSHHAILSVHKCPVVCTMGHLQTEGKCKSQSMIAELLQCCTTVSLEINQFCYVPLIVRTAGLSLPNIIWRSSSTSSSRETRSSNYGGRCGNRRKSLSLELMWQWNSVQLAYYVVCGEQRLVVNKDLWRLVNLVVVTLVILLLVCSNLRRKRWP